MSGGFEKPNDFADSIPSNPRCLFGYCTSRSVFDTTWKGQLLTGTDTLANGTLTRRQTRTNVYAGVPVVGVCDLDNCDGHPNPLLPLHLTGSLTDEKFRIDVSGKSMTINIVNTVGTQISAYPVFVNTTRYLLPTGVWIDDPMSVYDSRRAFK